MNQMMDAIIAVERMQMSESMTLSNTMSQNIHNLCQLLMASNTKNIKQDEFNKYRELLVEKILAFTQQLEILKNTASNLTCPPAPLANEQKNSGETDGHVIQN